jgi:hypothetical protein
MKAAVLASAGVRTSASGTEGGRGRHVVRVSPPRQSSGSTYTQADIEAARARNVGLTVTGPTSSPTYIDRSASDNSSPHETSQLPVRVPAADLSTLVPISLRGPETPRGPFAPPPPGISPARHESPPAQERIIRPSYVGRSGGFVGGSSNLTQSPSAPLLLGGGESSSTETARTAIQNAIAKAVESAVRAEAEHARLVHSNSVASITKQFHAYTNIKSATVALFAAAAFAQSLILALKLRSSQVTTQVGMDDDSRGTRRTLRELLGVNLTFAGMAMIATLILLTIGGARPDSVYTRLGNSFCDKARRKLGLVDEEHAGWMCKSLNALCLVFAFAVAVTATSIATFYTAPELQA